MANPIADSAAATVRTNRAKIWPTISSKNVEKTIRLKLTAKSINSIDINIKIIFFLFNIIPQRPIKNNEIATKRNLL